MRFFVAIGVASLGVGCFAVAALLWDRRAVFRRWVAQKQRKPEPTSGEFASVMSVLLVLGIILLVLLWSRVRRGWRRFAAWRDRRAYPSGVSG